MIVRTNITAETSINAKTILKWMLENLNQNKLINDKNKYKC